MRWRCIEFFFLFFKLLILSEGQCRSYVLLRKKKFVDKMYLLDFNILKSFKLLFWALWHTIHNANGWLLFIIEFSGSPWFQQFEISQKSNLSFLLSEVVGEDFFSFFLLLKIKSKVSITNFNVVLFLYIKLHLFAFDEFFFLQTSI